MFVMFPNSLIQIPCSMYGETVVHCDTNMKNLNTVILHYFGFLKTMNIPSMLAKKF